jgi:3-oxoacyl-[acyl-carrier protein] reductase
MTSVKTLFDLSGRSALITGGGGALGGAIGLGLSQAGAEVIIADINLQNASSVAAKIRAAGGTAHAFLSLLSANAHIGRAVK